MEKREYRGFEEGASYRVVPVLSSIIVPYSSGRLATFGIEAGELETLQLAEVTVLFFPLKEYPSVPVEELARAAFFPLGVAGKIDKVWEAPTGTFIQATMNEKVSMSYFRNLKGTAVAAGSLAAEVNDMTPGTARKKLRALKNIVAPLADGNPGVMDFVESCGDINQFAGKVGQAFQQLTIDEKYELLEADSLSKRADLISKGAKEYVATCKVESDIAKMMAIDEIPLKIAAAKKKMLYLQREIDFLEGRDTEEDSLKKRVERSAMPEAVKKEVMKDVKKLEMESPSSAEYNLLYSYVDFMLQLPWEADESGKIDLAKARAVLDKEHYGLEKVKERFIEQLAVMSLKGEQSGSILLLIGPPGTGKTSLGKSIADALGRKYSRVSLGGVRDEAEIRGHRRTYVGAMPGRIMQGIKRAGSANPVVVLDEIDKLCSSYSGDPSAALLEVLDPEQNSNFTDHYLNVPYDLSNVLFICTANAWDTIPAPLLDRMEVIGIPGYTPEEHFQIGKKHLLARALKETGLKKGDLKVTDAALKKIISEYTMEAGVRGLYKQLLAICRKAAVKLTEEGASPVKVGPQDLGEYLGNKKVRHDKVGREARPGVVTGLAYTQAGGEILFIETLSMAGKGDVKLTGQIGDVMKESAETAVSLLRSRVLEDGYLSEHDLHIHVPAGAVPKDGPSAGITMFTALVSLVTGRKVPSSLAMTGEISLRGQVLPIGGLPEKLMAAQRAGVKKVLIPQDNVEDLEEVSEEVRSALEIVPVGTVDDVLRETGLSKALEKQ